LPLQKFCFGILVLLAPPAKSSYIDRYSDCAKMGNEGGIGHPPIFAETELKLLSLPKVLTL